MEQRENAEWQEKNGQRQSPAPTEPLAMWYAGADFYGAPASAPRYARGKMAAAAKRLFKERSAMRDFGWKRIWFAAVISWMCIGGALRAQDAKKTIQIAADLREAPKRVFHAKMEFPVSAGPLTLVYPKWIPGEHGPNGPIVDVTGLRFRAGGKEIAWRRDSEDMFAFHLDVPAGVNE